MFFGPGSINPCVCGVYAFTLEKYILLKAITPITAFAYAPEITQKMIEEDSSYAAAIIKHYCTMTNLVMVRGMFSKSLDSLYKVSNFLYLFSLRNPYYGMNGSWSCEKIELSQEEIASFVGISRIQVARSLAQLREEKIIRTFRGKVQIIDKEKLKGYCASIIDEEL